MARPSFLNLPGVTFLRVGTLAGVPFSSDQLRSCKGVISVELMGPTAESILQCLVKPLASLSSSWLLEALGKDAERLLKIAKVLLESTKQLIGRAREVAEVITEQVEGIRTLVTEKVKESTETDASGAVDRIVAALKEKVEAAKEVIVYHSTLLLEDIEKDIGGKIQELIQGLHSIPAASVTESPNEAHAFLCELAVHFKTANEALGATRDGAKKLLESFNKIPQLNQNEKVPSREEYGWKAQYTRYECSNSTAKADEMRAKAERAAIDAIRRLQMNEISLPNEISLTKHDITGKVG